MLSVPAPVRLWRRTVVPWGPMREPSRSPMYVCVMFTKTLTLVIVSAVPTATALVTRVVLLSGIARFGLVVDVSTWFPPPPAALTTRVTPVLWESAPLVPLIVSGYVPAGVLADVVTLRVELVEAFAGGVTGFGVKEPDAPDGRPPAGRVGARE